MNGSSLPGRSASPAVGPAPAVIDVARSVGATVRNIGERVTAWGICAIFSPFALLNSDFAIKALVGLAVLDIPLQIGTHIAPNDDAAAVGAISGFDVSITTIALLALYIAWFSGALRRLDHRLRPSLQLSLWPFLYGLFVTVSVLMASNVTLSMYELFVLAQMLLLYTYVSSTTTRREQVQFIVFMLLAGLFVESAIMIASLSTGGYSLSIGGHSLMLRAPLGRGAGTVGSPNLAGGYIAMLLTPALSVAFTNMRSFYKVTAICTFAVSLVGLILTGSRGGWLGFAISLIVFCLFMSGRMPRLWLAVALVANVFIIVIVASFDVIMTRLYGPSSAVGAAGRLPLLELAWQVIVSNPVLGIGANNFALVAKDYVQHNNVWHEWFYTVHNKYLLVWAETGLGGLLTFLACCIVTIRRFWKSWKCHDQLLSPLALGFMAGILGMMTHMLFDMFHGRPVLQAFWLIAALATAMRPGASGLWRSDTVGQ